MVLKILNLFDLIPGWVWAAVCAFLLLNSWGLRVQIANGRAEISAAQTKFAKYEAEVNAKAAAAERERRDVELHNFRNSERIAHEQTKRDAALAAELSRYRRDGERMRNELNAFRANAARDAERGDVARLAARADHAAQLYGTCRDEYRAMAEDAERLRLQALGLWSYIRGNSMCSTPFGPSAP